MTREAFEKAIDLLDNLRGMIEDNQGNDYDFALKKGIEALKREQGSDEMTVEEYRQRMMQTFLDTDCEELIALCVLPTEKDFEHLKWLLKNHYKKEEPCEEWLLKNYYKKEPCEDTISRKAVFETIDDCNSDGLKGIFCSYVDGEKFKKYIKELPPIISKGVTVTDFADKCRECGKMKKGEWVKYSFPRAGEQHYQCTNCKEYVNFGTWGDYYTKDFKYCPHCGAEMRGGVKNDG